MWKAAGILLPAMRRLSFLLLAAVPVAGMSAAYAQERQTITPETLERWMHELSNPGRWGDDHQLGTLNLITAERRLRRQHWSGSAYRCPCSTTTSRKRTRGRCTTGFRARRLPPKGAAGSASPLQSTAEAERIAAVLNGMTASFLWGSNMLWAARIAAALGRHAQALALMRTAFVRGGLRHRHSCGPRPRRPAG